MSEDKNLALIYALAATLKLPTSLDKLSVAQIHGGLPNTYNINDNEALIRLFTDDVLDHEN